MLNIIHSQTCINSKLANLSNMSFSNNDLVSFSLVIHEFNFAYTSKDKKAMTIHTENGNDLVPMNQIHATINSVLNNVHQEINKNLKNGGSISELPKMIVEKIEHAAKILNLLAKSRQEQNDAKIAKRMQIMLNLTKPNHLKFGLLHTTANNKELCEAVSDCAHCHNAFAEPSLNNVKVIIDKIKMITYHESKECSPLNNVKLNSPTDCDQCGKTLNINDRCVKYNGKPCHFSCVYMEKDYGVLERTLLDCAVCCCSFDNEEIIIRRECISVYHSSCFDRCYQMKNECPCCRVPIVDSDLYKQF